VGTLWEGRFRSVLVENTRVAVRAVAAYIDLNPVRAGVVDDPKDYRFSGYGEAVGSGRLRQYGLWRRIGENKGDRPEMVAARYREYLFVSALDPRKGRPLTAEQVRAVREQGGTVGIAQLLRCRLRYMTQGAIIGTQAFVEEWSRRRRGSAAGGDSAPVVTAAGGLEAEGLFTASKRG
ncbi:MAG: hypothetical protein JJT96_15905, partial [Opitutales bacterium]|nr:hypothetical protein [Opitutales bacterium]